MLKFFHKNRKTRHPAFSWLTKDIHSHLLPGIDDGSPDLDTTLHLLEMLGDAGIRDFICTPHIIGDRYRNTPEIINGALRQVQDACSKRGMDFRLRAAAEYMLDDYFMECLRSKQPLLTLEQNYILTEFSYAVAPQNVEEISFEILTSGYQPVLAHPERYAYFNGSLPAFQRLKELGFLLQINLLSLVGYYGKPAEKTAKTLLRKNMVDFVGTDLHHVNHLEILTAKRSVAIFEKLLGDRLYNDFSAVGQA